MNNQLTIFDEMYLKYKITKPIRLIEMFSGYGSQALALKYLNVPFEYWKICEWAVKRILTECKELGTLPQILLMENVPQVHGTLPQILLMENVPQVHGTDNIQDFNKWQIRLEELGYKSYWKDLIATDYGIPQTRNRCFMVSILGDYNYSFPKPIPLKLKLKDMLEDNVKEKYYIDNDLLQYIIKTKKEHLEYTQYDRYNGAFEQLCRVWKDKSKSK